MTPRAAALALLLVAAPAFAADPFASPWSVSAKSRARLIADATGAGLEIELAPGAVTYWRDPGEAGVPPSFDFAGSEHLARAEVEFPAPERIEEPDGSVAFGYRNGVILPIVATPADPGKPLKLAVQAQYGVCEKICLPARASAQLTLDAAAASPFAAPLAQSRARLPQLQDAAALGAKAEPTGAKTWRLCFAERPRELFVEAPEGFWIEPKREADGRCFALTQRQAPDDAKAPLQLRLTVEGETGATETRVTLGG